MYLIRCNLSRLDFPPVNSGVFLFIASQEHVAKPSVELHLITIGPNPTEVFTLAYSKWQTL